MSSSTDARTSFGPILETPCCAASITARWQRVLITRGMPREISATLFNAGGVKRSRGALAMIS
jgi:hypothetical protein